MTREFHLSPHRKGGVSCDADGAFVGAIPILDRLQKDGIDMWCPRDSDELSKQLGEYFGLPIDMSSKKGGLKAIANALNEGDVARAQIATVLLGIPDAIPLSKQSCSLDQIEKLIHDLQWSGLLKWDADEHPRWPAGSDDSVGGQFAPKGEGDEPDASFTLQSDPAGRAEPNDADSTGRDPRTQLADAGTGNSSGDVIGAAARAAATHRGSKSHLTPPGVTAAEMAIFGPLHLKEAQQLAAKLGHGATASEFLTLSSVESKWVTSDAAKQAFNFFGAHNIQGGPFPGQIGTYVTSGTEGIPGSIVSRWLPPNSPRDPVQNVAAFSPETGYLDSGEVVVAALLRPKALAESGGDYSDPATFFATVHSNGWAERPQNDYVGMMLQRMKHF